MFITILIAFFSIIALLIIHEFGHFIMAKRFGIEVKEFGVGLPPRLFGKKIGGTVYSLNLLPFGAFVKRGKPFTLNFRIPHGLILTKEAIS